MGGTLCPKSKSPEPNWSGPASTTKTATWPRWSGSTCPSRSSRPSTRPRATREAKTPQLSFFDYWEPQEGDTFVNAWTSYRTRRDRTLELKTDPHVYEQPGTYRIMVKVIDIFGNDTSQVFEVKVA